MPKRVRVALSVLAVFVVGCVALLASIDFYDDPSSTVEGQRTVAIPTSLQGRPTARASDSETAIAAIQTTNARNAGPSKTVEAASAALAPKLAIISWTCSTGAAYITCEGFVQNISQSAIKNVTAVIVYEDETGTPVSSDDALIDYDPLLVNQTSPFKVLTRYNPGFKKASIEFRELFGGKITARDDSTAP